MIEDSINIPILKLRTDLPKLDEEAVYVVRSKGDKRADLAAFILLENGFDAYVLHERGAWPFKQGSAWRGPGPNSRTVCRTVFGKHVLSGFTRFLTTNVRTNL